MAKRVQVSDDAFVTNLTLPGGTGGINRETTPIEDTIFGQTFQSNEVGLIGWNISANALWKGFAGFNAEIKQQGATTAMVTEACSLESGKIYAVDEATRDLWDRSVAMTVFDNAVDETANVEWIDFLFGRVKFLDAHTVTGPVTVTGSFFPKIVLGRANTYSLTQTADSIEDSDFETVQANGGFRTFDPGLRTVAVELGGIYDDTKAFRTVLASRAEIIIEINPDGNDLSRCRGFFKLATQGQDGDVGALEEENLNFNLNVPDMAILLRPFGWQHDVATTLNQAIRIALDAWEAETKVAVRYLPNDVGGAGSEQGPSAVVTEVSLTGGLEGMNEFTTTFTGDGIIEDVP